MKSIIAILILLLSEGCTLFEKDETVLAKHTKSNGEEVNIYYISLGATTNDVMQVRSAKQKNPLWISDKYNCLKSSKLINDTLLQLLLTDTGYHNTDNNVDTVIISIK